MTASKYPQSQATTAARNDGRLLDTPEVIDRLATELRARCAGELPQAFYVEQVKRQLSGRTPVTAIATGKYAKQKPPEPASVFHAWALGEQR